MRLIGMMPVRNEDWCLGFTLRVALRWCDEVMVFLHACNDRSQEIAVEIAREHNPRVSVHAHDGEQWDEMRHRQTLLGLARARGATHLAIIDADEFLTANLLGGVRQLVVGLAPGQLLNLPGYNLREKGRGSHDHELPGWQRVWQYHINGVWGNRWFSTAFLDSPGACWGGDQFHHREPMGVAWRRWNPVPQGEGGTLHLWGASERRLGAKHALYRITERLRWPEKPAAVIERYYSQATTPREPWTFRGVPAAWLEAYQDYIPYLDIDADPWQAAEVVRLLEIHGRDRFAGLDLLGY